MLLNLATVVARQIFDGLVVQRGASQGSGKFGESIRSECLSLLEREIAGPRRCFRMHVSFERAQQHAFAWQDEVKQDRRQGVGARGFGPRRDAGARR